jgi:hypothetical protein
VCRDAEPEQKAEMEDFAFEILEALNANQQLDMLSLLGPKYGLDPHNIVMMATSLPNFAEFNSLMYMHTVMPNLKNLGLVTERTEQQYRDLGILWGKQRQEIPAEGFAGFGAS